jgi:hypothetical protein
MKNGYGALVEWDWHRKTEVLGEKPATVPVCPPQVQHGLTWYRSRAFAVIRLWNPILRWIQSSTSLLYLFRICVNIRPSIYNGFSYCSSTANERLICLNLCYLARSGALMTVPLKWLSCAMWRAVVWYSPSFMEPEGSWPCWQQPATWDLRSSGVLRSVEWQSFTNVSGHSIGYIFLTLDDGTDTVSRNVGKGLPFDAA